MNLNKDHIKVLKLCSYPSISTNKLLRLDLQNDNVNVLNKLAGYNLLNYNEQTKIWSTTLKGK